MEQPVFACIAPHGWLTVPLVSGRDGEKADAARAALTELGRRLADAQPETIVIIDPHNLQVEGLIALLDSDRLHGETGGPPNLGATAHTFSLRFATDRVLNGAIAEQARARGLPVARARNAFPFVPLPLDYGSMNPLWYLGATMMPPAQLVVASLGPDVPRAAYVDFGRALRAAVDGTKRRIAFIASADMGHRHAADGPYGFDSASGECDSRVVEAIRAGALDQLVHYDEGWLARAFTDAVEPLLVLHGLTKGRGWRGDILSYEVPTYFGLLCADYRPA